MATGQIKAGLTLGSFEPQDYETAKALAEHKAFEVTSFELVASRHWAHGESQASSARGANFSGLRVTSKLQSRSPIDFLAVLKEKFLNEATLRVLESNGTDVKFTITLESSGNYGAVRFAECALGVDADGDLTETLTLTAPKITIIHDKSTKQDTINMEEAGQERDSEASL